MVHRTGLENRQRRKPFVGSNPTPSASQSARFSAHWHKALTGQGQKVRFHDLRHTHATLLLRQGIHPKVVSERLGHSTINITLDTYSHVMPDMQDEAAEKLNGVLKAAMGAASRRRR